MCGRYAIYDIDGIGLRYDVEIPDNLKPNYNGAPSQRLPVIIRNKDANELEIMKWGITRVLGQDQVKDLINTRSEKAFGRFWKKNVTERRCLIPANGFYEWKTVKSGKVPFFIKPKDQDMFSFAGIWSEWKDEKGNSTNSFSIMTTDANENMNGIHDRMPVMLLPHEEDAWLSIPAADEEALSSLLRGYKSQLILTEASRDVNSVKNNFKELIPNY